MKSVRESTPRKRKEAPAETDGQPSSAPPPEWNGALPEGEASDLAPVVGTNLRRLRMRRGLSLEKLSQRSGVSRAMLGQIELGQSAPTINVLWKIARALDVTFATLIQAREAGGTMLMKTPPLLVSTFACCFFISIVPPASPSKGVEDADAHAPGTVENLVVIEGTLDISISRHDGPAELHRLDAGDAILFEADVPHSYVNVGPKECVMYLVMTYADQST